MTAPTGTFFPVVRRYPAGPITPAGGYHLLADHIPTMKYRSYDDTTVFAVYGGEAIYDPTMPESVQVTDLKGLIAPFQNITQKGATQDGATYIDSLYDPIEVDITVRIRGRDGAHVRQVQRDWIAAWDAKKPGTLSWFSHSLGYWWAPVQLNKAPVDKLTGGNQLPQAFIWPAIAYNAFWQSFDDVDSFGFIYGAPGSDQFDNTTSEGLTGWTIHYSLPGGWLFESNTLTIFDIPLQFPGGGGCAQWQFDLDNPIDSDGVDAVAINNTYVSDTDNQVVSLVLGSTPGWLFDGDAYNDLWFRCPPPGVHTPGLYGLRLRFGIGVVTLSCFVAGTETVLRTQQLLIPPLPGETWSVISSGRTYTIQRGLIGLSTVMAVTEMGTTSQMGSGYRCAGLGVHAAPGASPGAIQSWAAGDNAGAAQSGFLRRINMGDQPMWDRYTLYGPGTFTIGDGPNNGTNAVNVGPLLPNQVVQVRTDPRKRGLTDLTSQPASPQELTAWQTALEDFLSFAIGNNTSPLVAAIESEFGILAPQGNPYSLLNGRFSDNAGIPPRPVAGPVPAYEVPVSITGGNANSRILVAGTPLRRFPY